VSDNKAEAGAGTRVRLALALTGSVLALDQAAKAATSSLLERGERVDLLLGFQVANVRNRGIAFGLFDDLDGGQGPLIAVTVVAVAVICIWFARNAARPWLWLPAGLLTGGALGNLVDRLRIDAVIDFIDPPLWPAFNVADIAIVAGIATLAVLVVMRGNPPNG
jgi:signal peptidase II